MQWKFGTAARLSFGSSSAQLSLCLLPVFPHLQALNATASWAFTLENRQGALLGKLSSSTLSMLSELNSFKIVRCPIPSTRLGLRPQRFLVSLVLFFRLQTSRVAKKAWRCGQLACLTASTAVGEIGNCCLVFLGLYEYHLCLLWKKLPFPCRMENFLQSQNFGVNSNFWGP